jgi:hypothetical protein
MTMRRVEIDNVEEMLEKTDPKKIRLSVSIHPSIVEWMQENSGSVVENKPFRSITDLIEQAIILLKEKMESKK